MYSGDRMEISGKATVIILVVVGVCTLLHGTTIVSHGSEDLSARQDLQSPLRDGLSCGDERSWAGVYVDSTTKEVLFLDRGGGASFSPGTAAGAKNDISRWESSGGILHIVGDDDRPLLWPGVTDHLQRHIAHAGKLSGFDGREEASGRGRYGDDGDLLRDPLGFMFPGCTYLLTVKPDQPCTVGIGHEYRVVVDRDGTVIDTANGGMVARWYFPGMPPLSGAGDELWPTGDEILLLFEKSHHQLRSVVSAPGGDAACEFKLSSLDGGRTWRPVTTYGQAEEKVVPNYGVAGVDDLILLTLVIPSAVSMFPLTSALRPLERYLNGGRARKFSLEENETFSPDERKIEPIVQIFEAQPFRYGGNDGGTAEFQAVIVISRAVPRPIERKEDLACVVNGIVTRAVWLSWSMVLCSSAHVMGEEATLSMAFRSERFSSEVTFRRAPPPRHVRLAWPPVETFDLLPRGDIQMQSRHRALLPLRNATNSGVPEIRPFRTTIALCTMFKNEARYLGEWLRYHKRLGVSKVYMYDNGSSDESREILKKFEHSHFVEVREWPHQGAQTEALNDCLSRFRHKTRWISFIDVDEFIDPAPTLPVAAAGDLVETTLDRPEHLRPDLYETMASRNKRLSNLLGGWAPDRHTHCMAWINYCSSGQISKPEGGVLENYAEIEDIGERKIHMQKPLFKALEALTLRRIGPHFLLFATEDIDEQYSRNLKCPYEWLDPGEFRIRHYRSKSLEEYVQRRTGTDSAYRTKRYTKEQLESEWRTINARCGQGRD